MSSSGALPGSGMLEPQIVPISAEITQNEPPSSASASAADLQSAEHPEQPAETPAEHPKIPEKTQVSFSHANAESENAVKVEKTDDSEMKTRSSSSKTPAGTSSSKVVIHPRLKPVVFSQYISGKLPMKPHSVNHSIAFYNSEEYPINKRGFKYKPCTAHGGLSANLYATSELAPYKVRPSFFDRLAGIAFSENMDCVTTADGWRSIRTNMGIAEGTYYMEFEIVNANNPDPHDRSHVRIGLARKEAALEGPVGFDGYGYALRDVNGQKVTLSRPKNFAELGFTSGDVMGFLVHLPSLKDHRAAVAMQRSKLAGSLLAAAPPEAAGGSSSAHGGNGARKKRKTKGADSVNISTTIQKHGNVVRDQVPIKYKSSLYFEQYEYTPSKRMEHLLNPVTVFGEKAILENSGGDNAVPSLPTIPGSRIVVYKNGVEVGTMFEDLYSFLPTLADAEAGITDAEDFNVKQAQNPNYRYTDDGSLGYYPMISVYQGGIVRFNPGPEFKYPVAASVKPMSERYNDRVTEEWMWDLIDEVEAQYIDEAIVAAS